MNHAVQLIQCYYHCKARPTRGRSGIRPVDVMVGWNPWTFWQVDVMTGIRVSIVTRPRNVHNIATVPSSSYIHVSLCDFYRWVMFKKKLFTNNTCKIYTEAKIRKPICITYLIGISPQNLVTMLLCPLVKFPSWNVNFETIYTILRHLLNLNSSFQNYHMVLPQA